MALPDFFVAGAFLTAALTFCWAFFGPLLGVFFAVFLAFETALFAFLVAFLAVFFFLAAMSFTSMGWNKKNAAARKNRGVDPSTH